MKNLSRKTRLAALALNALSLFLSAGLFAQVPQGFNYQAIARNSAGDPIANTSIKVMLSVLTDTNGFYNGSISPSKYIWEEEHFNVKTNAFGLFTVALGTGGRVQGVASFSSIVWQPGPFYIGTKIANPTLYKPLGGGRLWSVPYSLVAGDVNGTLSKLDIKSATTLEVPLFEVKNNTGQTIFAVYNKGIRAYVDADNKAGTKGGFAIGGFGTAKAPSQPLMVISPDSARIYVDETNAKGSKGGFAIGGFNAGKGTTSEFMYLAPDNYFIGDSSGKMITALGLYNSTLGYKSGRSLTNGQQNVFMGYKSGYSTSTGNANIFIGSSTGLKNSTGYWNIFLGRDAGYFNTLGHANIVIGDWAGKQNTIGNENVFVGDYAGGQNKEGSQNVFIGASAGINSMTGDSNTYLGYHAGFSGVNASGFNNIFMGVMAGFDNTTGFDNIAIGNRAGYGIKDGAFNVMVGSASGNKNESGNYNTMVGYRSGENHAGDYATLLGYLAGNSTTSGNSQTMVGYQAGIYNNGAYNTYVGVLTGGSSGTGSFNTYIGLAAGKEATGSNNVFIGKWAGWMETGSDKLIIENNYSDVDNLNNALVYGDFTANYLKVNGQILNSTTKSGGWAADFKNAGGTASYWGLNVTAGANDGAGRNYMIDFNNGSGAWKGSIVLENNVIGFYQVSDTRQKENIAATGMNAINILNDISVVDYNFTKSPGVRHTGYIAQDVEKVFPEMVIYNERVDTYAISTSTLIPVLHKAILEQQQLIEAQSKKIAELEAAVRLLMNK